MLPYTRADSLRPWLTGAASAGAAQPEASLALGGYRSSSRAGSLGCLLTNAIRGIVIDYVSGANGAGVGSLNASGDLLVWTPPGDAAGAAATVLASSVGVVTGSDPTKFLNVTRDATATLTGTCSVEIVDVFNDIFGQSNGTLPAGATYRCVMLKNGPGQNLNNLKIWIGAQDNPIAIALETPASQPDGAVQTIANESTAPTGVFFSSPTTSGGGLSVTNLAPNQQVGLWIKRDLTAASAAALARTRINWSYMAIG